MKNEIGKIMETVQVYWDGVYNGVDEMPPEIFEEAHMISTTEDGELIDAMLTGLQKKEGRPFTKNQERFDRIVKIDIASENLAYAEVKCANLPNFYTDVLCMVKNEGKWQIVAKVWDTATSLCDNWFDDIAQQDEEIKAIREVLAGYFAGVWANDVELTVSQFMEGATMISTDAEGKRSVVPLTSLKDSWAGKQSPKEKGEAQFAKIHHIEMTGPRTAVAKVETTKLPLKWTDYLQLVKFDGSWKIVNKTTTAQDAL